MKRVTIILILMLCGIHVHAQRYNRYDAGLGIRLGDPFGLSYKYYMPDQRAFELNLGSTFPGLYGNYFSNVFNEIDGYQNFNYLNHTVSYSLAIQGRLLFHQLFPQNIPGLRWYYGFGAQLRLIGVDYRFQNAENRIRNASYTDLGIGPEGILGAEYVIPDSPLTVFADISLFMEIINNPMLFRFQGGIGLRYNFSFYR